MALAQEAAWRAGLQRVLFVPTGRAPHKRIEQDPGAEVRLEMAGLAVEGEPGLSATAIEVEREGVSYTADTLAMLAEASPGDELRLILGADAAAGLPSWHEPERICGLAGLVIAGREGFSEQQVREAIGRIGAPAELELIDLPAVAISSSMIRRRIRAGAPVRHLVPVPVAEMIEARRLYREGDAESDD